MYVITLKYNFAGILFVDHLWLRFGATIAGTAGARLNRVPDNNIV
jgi:hypothetical protein